MARVRPGFAFVAGRSKDNASALLAAATRAGRDPSAVKTVDNGYIVPEDVLDALAESPGIDDDDPAEQDQEPAGEGRHSLDDEKTPREKPFDVEAASYPQLKSEAKRRGLSGKGTREELTARLLGHTEGE